MSAYRNVRLPKCPLTKMSAYQNVRLPKCPLTKMSAYQNVRLPKCPMSNCPLLKRLRLFTADPSGAQYKEVCWRLDERGGVGETPLHVCLLNATSIHADLAKRLLRHHPKLIKDIYISDEFYGRLTNCFATCLRLKLNLP